MIFFQARRTKRTGPDSCYRWTTLRYFSSGGHQNTTECWGACRACRCQGPLTPGPRGTVTGAGNSNTICGWKPRNGNTCFDIWKYFIKPYMSQSMTKPTKWPVHPGKTQISLDICPVWSESSLCALQIAKDPRLLHSDSQGSDQTGRMPPGWSESSLVLFVCQSVTIIWAGPWENVSYVTCEQQRRRSACASAQSDQHLCCSLL